VGSFFSGIGIRIAIVGLIVVGGFLLLQVGDCFDVPAATTVSEVQHHPCSEPHTGEVFHIFDFVASTSAYPTDEEFASQIVATCETAFQTYTGVDPANSPNLTWDVFFPLEEGWSEGDREISCYLYQVDGATMTQSYKLGAS
jgi:hypothetical protein